MFITVRRATGAPRRLKGTLNNCNEIEAALFEASLPGWLTPGDSGHPGFSPIALRADMDSCEMATVQALAHA